jgi:hypothetical protein
MTAEEFLAYFQDHPELIQEALKLMREIQTKKDSAVA